MLQELILCGQGNSIIFVFKSSQFLLVEAIVIIRPERQKTGYATCNEYSKTNVSKTALFTNSGEL
jgi:hypothetical protein